MPAQFEPRRAEERHREVTTQAYAVAIVPDDHGKAFDQVLPVVPVIENAGSEEERDGGVDGGLGPTIPDDPQACVRKSRRLSARDRELQGAQHRGTLQSGAHRRRAGRRQVNAAARLADSRSPRRRRHVGPRSVEQIENILGGGRFAVPTGHRTGQRRAFHELVVDVIPRAVEGARITHAERLLEADRHPHQVCALGLGPGEGQRRGEQRRRLEDRTGYGMERIRRTVLSHEVVGAVHLVVPGTAVPVVVAGEIENAGALDVERDVVVVGQLIEEVGSVGPFVAASPVIRAAHVSASADALVGPALPHAVGV